MRIERGDDDWANGPQRVTLHLDTRLSIQDIASSLEDKLGAVFCEPVAGPVQIDSDLALSKQSFTLHWDNFLCVAHASAQIVHARLLGVGEVLGSAASPSAVLHFMRKLTADRNAPLSNVHARLPKRHAHQHS